MTSKFPSACLLGIAFLFGLFPGLLQALPRTWDGGGANALASTPANWAEDTAPVTGDDIILNTTSHKNMTWDLDIDVGSWTQAEYTGTVTIATVVGASGFTNFHIVGNCIISNGVWTHIANPAVDYETNRLSVTIGGDLIVGASGAIDVYARGYKSTRGPGRANGSSGGSYGGRGAYYGVVPGPCYGSITAPTNLGSGGGWTAGGGAILLSVAGQVRHDGLISANGGSDAYHTGSGGSVFLKAGAVSGAGTIRANGGLASNGNPYGGGGGGRIAMILTSPGKNFLSYTGVCEARGYPAVLPAASSFGTIYLETPDDSPGKGELIVGGSGVLLPYDYRTDINGLEAVTCEFARITLANGAVLGILTNNTLIVSNTVFCVDPASPNEGMTLAGGTLLAKEDFAFSNFFIRISGTNSQISSTSSLTIGTNAELRVDRPFVVDADFIVSPGGMLTHTPNPGGNTEAYKMSLGVLGNLTIEDGGKVDVTAKGFLGGYGPGHPLVSDGGASHGGRGVNGYLCYGSIVAPTNLGSGGRSGGVTPGIGGGAIQLAVSGVISNYGRISANANNQTYRHGSGGSICITAGALAGTGPIEANSAINAGGTGDNPGGGGRVAIAVTNAGADLSGYPANMITAYGAKNNSGSGGAGTVYLRTAGQGLFDGTLIVDNNNLSGLTAEITSNVVDAVVGNVIIRNRGILGLASNQDITVSGIWSNSAGFNAQLGSQVIFAGPAASTSAVYGSNIFMGFVCTNKVKKTILFQAGITNTIPAQGRLKLWGSDSETNLVLRSTSDGASWMLNVNALADQSVMCVDVKNSDALTAIGAEVFGINSRDSGDNYNWRFIKVVPGETNTWTGGSSTVWSMPENWSQERAPMPSDFILIPSGQPRYPVLDNHRTVNGIELQPGASLELAGYDLTVTKPTVIAGSLVASLTETITFNDNVDFSGGAFTHHRSTVVLAGSALQTVNLGELVFFKVEILNSDTVLFDGGFSATELRCEAPAGTRNMIFKQGAAFFFRDLTLLGALDSTNIILRSSVSGQAWNLAVSGPRWSVQGVDVMDSDASSGVPVPAVYSRDSGRNVNWLFNAAADRSEWLGTKGVNFFDPANWSPAGVPGPLSRVLVQAANPMSITGAVTLLDLTVGGGAGKASVTVIAPLTVIENITVITNGSLSLNRPSVVSNGLYVLDGGLLTHAGPQQNTESNKLDVTIFGNMETEEFGKIDVSGRGHAAGRGPGTPGSGNTAGASYGGYGGWYVTDGYYHPCYGSVVAPTNLGSGAGNTEGGGAILLAVAGTIRHDGSMISDGIKAPSYYAGSGGTISIRAGALTGLGMIRANGGDYTSTTGAGGGGRVALVVTNAGADFSGFTGSVIARGGAPTGAGAGTIYRRRAAEKADRGYVLVDNIGMPGQTRVPPGPPNVTGEVNFVAFYITNGATLRLTNEYIIGDIYVQSQNSWVDLNNQTLIVRSREHPIGPGAATNAINFGAIIWWPDIPKGALFSTW